MSDGRSYDPFRPQAPRQAQLVEVLWTLRKDTDTQAAELRSHAGGVELQLSWNGEWFYGRRHEVRAFALAEAEARFACSSSRTDGPNRRRSVMKDSPTRSLHEQMAMFFRSPTTELPPSVEPIEVSTLYLLRRELQECLFPAAIVDEDKALAQAGTQRCRGIASAMVMFAGIDALARFAVVGQPPRGEKPQ